jgi:membrane-associated phospholipid phosphatase
MSALLPARRAAPAAPAQRPRHVRPAALTPSSTSQQALPGGGVVRDPALLYPVRGSTIPGGMLFGLAFGLPAALCVLCNALAPPPPGAAGRLSARALARGTRDVHHLMLAVLQAYALASCWKIWLNKGVGRPRPDWYAALADAGSSSSSSSSRVDEAQRASYPSGHAAYSHSSGAVCFWYAAARLRAFRADAHAQLPRLLLAAAPVGLATAIAATRLTDYRHNFSDVNAGTFIGLVAGTACFHLHFCWAAPLRAASAEEAAHAARAMAHVRPARGRWAAAAADAAAPEEEPKERGAALVEVGTAGDGASTAI